MSYRNMISDISQRYEEKPFRYTRRPIVEDPPIEIIAECHLCGVKIASDQEVVTYKEETFCSKYHVKEYKQMEADGEI
jgi:hypothetical protein